MINNLPNGWKVEKLEKLCSFINGFAFKSSDYVDNSNTVSIRMSNIRPNASFDYTHNIRYLPDNFAEKYSQYILKDGDIIVAMTDMGQTMNILGVPTIVRKDINQNINFLLNQRVGKLFNFDKDIVLVDYIKLFMATDYIHNFYKQLGGGGLQINLSKKDLLSAPILIPPFQQQEKIVKVLDLTSNLIEKQKELLKKYDLFLKSKFIEMFGDPIKNPMGWETEKLGKLADWKGGGTPSRKKPEYFDGDIPWITTISLGKIYINEEDAVEFITNEAVDNSATKIIPKNSIIIGTRVGVGKVSINKSELCTNQDIMSMTNISTNLSNIFLYFFINYYNDFLKSQQRGATIQGITGPVLKDLDTILPPIELQNKFASIVEKIETIKEKENQKLKQLEDLHYSLMQKAFKGEIQ
ncbi:hypothetical protein CRU98_08485 [Arcobacter sp. CECT 8986]|uniref:restriction endonuclease subunit S n=1 Tax=Arcobacter sp. CECT 8986 TaxID=2044507 RepID=UPI0010099794|nr:restriction endonuclease subunit S [Arcobacter sp. CECT 8986]RXJ98792.1 hypothetical protein CRU98_08485 [Arcobacter sp. CECT 8986]